MGQRRVLFLSGGGQTGSLYHEVFARGGFRRWSPIKTLEYVYGTIDGWVAKSFRPLRFSGMVRAARVAAGAAFRDLATHSLAAQGSISYGWYDAHTLRPWMELEVGATIDSGIFSESRGDALEERFWTVALRVYSFTIETWNDQLNSKDFGPTYGVNFMMDLFFLFPLSSQKL